MIQTSLAVAQGDTIRDTDHNKVVTDIGALNSEIQTRAQGPRVVTQSTTAPTWVNGAGNAPTVVQDRIGQMGVDGSKAYSMGGYSASTTRNYNYEYNILTDTWATKAVLPVAGYYCSAVGGGNGFVYVCLVSASGAASPAFYRYSPSLNTWATMTSLPGNPANEPGMTVIGDYIYVVSGLPALYRYSISGNSWVTLAAPTFAATAAVNLDSKDGKLYATPEVLFGTTPVVHIYDVAGNSWSTSSAAPIAGTACNAGVIGQDLWVLVLNTSVVYPVRYSIGGKCWFNDSPTSPNAQAVGNFKYSSGLYGGRNGSQNITAFTVGTATKETVTSTGIAVSANPLNDLENYTSGAHGVAIPFEAGDQWGPKIKAASASVKSVVIGGQ